jgi:hypothetical protein
VLAEFADEVTEREPLELAKLLISRFSSCPHSTQALLLTALLKLRMAAMHDRQLRAHAESVFKECSRSQNAELQQRATEYLAMSRLGEDSVVMRETVMAPMPDWPGQGLLVLAGEDEEGVGSRGSRAADADPGGTPPSSAVDGMSPVATLAAGSAAETGGGEGSPERDSVSTGEDSPATPRMLGVQPLPEPVSDNLLDLSSPGDLLPSAALAAPAAAPETTPAAHATALPAEVVEARSPIPGPPTALAPAGPAAASTAAGHMARLLYQGKGILMEDSHLQVGVVSQRAGAAQSLLLYCANKTPTSPLDSFSVTVPHHPCFHITSSSPAHILFPQQQVVVLVTVQVLHNALSTLASPHAPPSPSAVISYSTAGKVRKQAVPLPIGLPIFARPHPRLEQEWFFSAWSTVAQAPACRTAAMTRLPTPVATAAALTAQMLQLGFWDGGVRLDPTSDLNFAGATALAGVDVLTRVEVNPSDTAQVNITVIVTKVIPGLANLFHEWLASGLMLLSTSPT